MGEDEKTRHEMTPWKKTTKMETAVVASCVVFVAVAVVVADDVDEEEMEEEKEGGRGRRSCCCGIRKRARWRWCSRESLAGRDLLRNERHTYLTQQ